VLGRRTIRRTRQGIQRPRQRTTRSHSRETSKRSSACSRGSPRRSSCSWLRTSPTQTVRAMTNPRRRLQRRVRNRDVARTVRAGGGAARADEPTPGWKARGTMLQFVNGRVPSVPTTLDLRLNEYFAGAVVMGLLAGQAHEPNKKWARKWSFDMGDEMANEALARRRRKPK